jgi:small redox-active disulfide protein 2
MMKVEVLGIGCAGIGCANCKKLLQNVETAVHELGISAEVIKVEDIIEIAGKGVLTPPGLIVNDEIKVVGRVAPIEEIKRILKASSP